MHGNAVEMHASGPPEFPQSVHRGWDIQGHAPSFFSRGAAAGERPARRIGLIVEAAGAPGRPARVVHDDMPAPMMIRESTRPLRSDERK